MGGIGIHDHGVGTGFLEFEGVGAQRAFGDLIGDRADQLGPAAGGCHAFFDPCQTHFAVVIILVKYDYFFGSAILNHPGSQILCFIFVVRVGDKSGRR